MRFPDGDDEEELVPMRATVVPVGAELIFGAHWLKLVPQALVT